MKGHGLWSYHPYQPLLFDAGEPYICRLAPAATAIRLEWQPTGQPCKVFCRRRGDGDFVCCGVTEKAGFDIADLSENTDYEFYVSSGETRSRVRLARTGVPVGTVVNYLHPDDEAYAFSGRYLCSPSLVRYPDGTLLASMDLYAHDYPQNLTLLFRSDDGGANWHRVSELMPCFWGKLFLHNGELYMLACSTEYGDLLIGKSTDKGETFSAPVALLRGSGGRNGGVGVHKNPQNVVSYRGRLYETLEWGSWANKAYFHAAMVMSCDENADLLVPENWHFTPPVKYDGHWPGAAPDGQAGTIEGTLCVAPDGGLYNLMRYQTAEKKILAYRVQADDPDAPLVFSHAVAFPGNLSKFMIQYDAQTRRYFSIVCRRIDDPVTNRNLLSLVVSEDLTRWETVCDLLDYRSADPDKVGFQYVDFSFDGDDLIYLCRTALNGANNFHDADYSTFHRVADFRALLG